MADDLQSRIAAFKKAFDPIFDEAVRRAEEAIAAGVERQTAVRHSVDWINRALGT